MTCIKVDHEREKTPEALCLTIVTPPNYQYPYVKREQKMTTHIS
jgi:hypothetical protein